MTDPNQTSPSARHLADAQSEPDSSSSTAAQAAQAKEAASDVAAHSKQQAAEVAETGKQAAGEVLEQTKQQAGDLLGKTRGQLREQVESQQASTVESLRSLVDQLSSMADNAQETGTAVDLAARARDRARTAADWLDGRSPDEVLDELRRFGRQRPGAFLLGAAVAGVVAGRMTRGVVAEHTEDDPTDRRTGAPNSTMRDLGDQAAVPATPSKASPGVPRHGESGGGARPAPAPTTGPVPTPTPETYARGEYRR